MKKDVVYEKLRVVLQLQDPEYFIYLKVHTFCKKYNSNFDCEYQTQKNHQKVRNMCHIIRTKILNQELMDQLAYINIHK